MKELNISCLLGQLVFFPDCKQEIYNTAKVQASILVLPSSIAFLYNSQHYINAIFSPPTGYRLQPRLLWMVKKPNKAKDQPMDLIWSWRPETLKLSLKGMGGSFTSNELLEQISTTADESDYLWYMTRYIFINPQTTI